MSPIEIRPTTLPSSTTGKWRNLPIVIISMMSADGVRLPAAHDLARHHRADRLVQHPAPRSPSTRTMSRSDRMPSMRPWFITSTAPILRSPQDLDRRRELCVRLDALDLMALGIENRTYRHCRLPESVRALEEPDLVRESSINSSAPVSFQARRQARPSCTAAASCLRRNVRMMNEIALRRKRDQTRSGSSGDDASAACGIARGTGSNSENSIRPARNRRYAPARRRWRRRCRSRSSRGRR